MLTVVKFLIFISRLDRKELEEERRHRSARIIFIAAIKCPGLGYNCPSVAGAAVI